DRAANRLRDAGDSARARSARRLPHSPRPRACHALRVEGGRPRARGKVRADGVAPGGPDRRRAPQGCDRRAEDSAAGVVRRREGLLRLMGIAEPKLHGCPSMTAPLRRVLLRAPREDDLRFWREYGWRAEPHPAGIAREHEALCELLAGAGAGAELVLGEVPVEGDPDAVYVYHPVLIAEGGAVLLRPG